MIQQRAATLLGEIVRASPQQLMRQATLLPGGAEPKYADKRRQGRPTHSWLELTMRRVWTDREGWNSLDDSNSDSHSEEPNQVRAFDINNNTHTDYIYRLGMNNDIRKLPRTTKLCSHKLFTYHVHATLAHATLIFSPPPTLLLIIIGA